MEGRRVGRELIDAIATQDWERLQACFAPEVQFRALIPAGARERTGAAETAALIGAWFGDANALELLDSHVEEVVDRLHVGYRFHAVEDGQHYLVQQHLYCVIGADESSRRTCSAPASDRHRPDRRSRLVAEFRAAWER